MKGWCWFLLWMYFGVQRNQCVPHSLIYTFYEEKSLGEKIEYSDKDADTCRFGRAGFNCWQKVYILKKCTKLVKDSIQFLMETRYTYNATIVCFMKIELMLAWSPQKCWQPLVVHVGCLPCGSKEADLLIDCVHNPFIILNALDCSYWIQGVIPPHSHQLKQWTVECQC